MNEWLSTDEAAAKLSKTDRQVRRDVKEGRLVGRKEGRKLFVSATSVEALVQEKAGNESSEGADGRGQGGEPEEDMKQDAVVDKQAAAVVEGSGASTGDGSSEDGGEPSGAGSGTETPTNGRHDAAPSREKGQGGVQDQDTGNGAGDTSPAAEKSDSGPIAVDKEELAQVFTDLRTMVDLHLQRVRTFHRLFHERIDCLEERLVFEQARNEEVQNGLAGILRELGLDPESVGRVTVDARGRKGFWERLLLRVAKSKDGR